MDGQSSEGIQKKKARTRIACDVGCQTDQSTSNPISIFAQGLLSASHSSVAGSQHNASMGQWDKPGKENGGGGTASSASASGASTPGTGTAASSSPAPSVATQASTDSKKLAGPAGVKPNEIEAYFGEKKPPSNNTTAPTAPLAVPPGVTVSTQQQQQQQPQKTRAASTTGVGGEAKKQVRNNAQPTAAAPTSSSTKGDGPSWNDESCKLRLVINRFSHLEETMCSPPKSIEGVSWKIMVMPKQHMVQKKQQKCMGFFLQCAPERAYSDQWSVHAIADMRMISYKPNVPHFARRTTHTYTSKENDWGYSCFMTWADIIDEAQGYIRDDTVVLEIAVKAEPPKNMMTHEDFLDKIEKWIVLADMQMKKGNIDLALEANQSALKFCKGKDDECSQKLETQRETFVNAKLFESIERIEKGPVVCTDTSHGKPTSLRQALTGAQKSLNGKITAKGGKKTRAVVTVQHMKKKKPYDQNNTTQQRNATGGPTVKDLVEKRKSSKDDAKKDLLKTKEELDAERDDQSDSEESHDEEKGTTAGGSEDDEEDDQEFDDEEYNEGDYGDQADECSTLGGEFGSSSMSGNAPQNEQDEEEDVGDEADVDDVWDDEEDLHGCDAELFKAAQVMKAIQTYQMQMAADSPSSSDEDVQVRDQEVQTEEPVYDDLLLDESPLFSERLLKETVITRFVGPDAEKAKIAIEAFQGKLGFQAVPADPIETVFGVEGIDGEETFTSDILDSLPHRMPPRANKDGSYATATMAEKLIKSWMDVEGSLTGCLDPQSVIARLSTTDRQDLIDELSFKLNPLIVTLDLEFRDTIRLARNFLLATRNALDDSNKMAAECEEIRKSFDERLSVKSNQQEPQQKRPVEITTTTKKTTTSAAATSGAGAKAVTHGRPTVIAKRSMKQVVPVDTPAAAGEQKDPAAELADIPEDGQNMRDVHMAFRTLNTSMTPMIAQIGANSRKVQKLFVELLGDNGTLPVYMKELSVTHNNQRNVSLKELNVTREALTAMGEVKVKLEKQMVEKEKSLAAEIERHLKTQKETKDLKNQLKKAESKATKEENRATGLQVQLNDLDEKSKMLRKELETLKKKSVEERAKTKKEKERDTQTIRQQSIEISERENERDKARKEIDEANRGKDKVEKEKKAVAAQLTAMTERARAGEVAVMESRCSAALEELKKRKEAVQNGYTETETLTSRVRQVSDRDVMRKSLAEWKAALDKCDAHLKSVKSDYDHAIEQIKSGVKTLVQTLEIKLPVADPLPKLVKPPPVQVVAPSASVIPPPIMPPTPAAGVIGQQRTTPMGRGDPGSPCATPTRTSRLPRVPSPVKTSATRTDDAPSSLWSWNTIGNIGDLRPSNESFNNSSMDSLQRDIWAANGNGNGSLGNDFLRGANTSSMSNPISNNSSMSSAQPSSPFLRQSSQQYASQQSQMQQQQQVQNSRMQQQQQQARGYGDMWNGPSMQQQQQPQQNSGPQEYGNARMMAHNGGGDLTNGGGYAPWQNPAQQQQLRGGGQPQQGHHNMFQQSHFYDSGM